MDTTYQYRIHKPRLISNTQRPKKAFQQAGDYDCAKPGHELPRPNKTKDIKKPQYSMYYINTVGALDKKVLT